MILGVAVGAERRLAMLVRAVGLVAFEVRRGGIEEQQVDLEIEEVRAREEHRFLQLAFGVGLDEQIHRAVALVLVHRRQAWDVDVLGCPLRGGELGCRRERAV